MSDENIVLARWEESPYTSHDKRGQTIDHRVRLLWFGDFGDVVHERLLPSRRTDWKTVEVIEIRDHGINHRKLRDGVMSE